MPPNIKRYHGPPNNNKQGYVSGGPTEGKFNHIDNVVYAPHYDKNLEKVWQTDRNVSTPKGLWHDHYNPLQKT